MVLHEASVFEELAVTPTMKARFLTSRVLIYGALLLWAFICLFPLYWTVTTSFKVAVNVTQGHLIPWVDFQPDWRGWRSLGMSPDTIGETSTVRDEFVKRFTNSVITSISASLLAIVIGSLAAYGLTRFKYRFAWMRNDDISFFFLSQLILPPVVLALPFLVLYKELNLLDSRIGLILLYALMVLPIVIWIMRDQFNSIPVELEEAALVDGLSIWGAFFQIVLPIALPGMVAAFVLSLVLCWNEYFFAALLTSTDAKTLPVMVASQTGSQGINWWSMAALSTAGHRAAGDHRHRSGTLHHPGHDRRRREIVRFRRSGSLFMKVRHWQRGGSDELAFTELGFGAAPVANLYRAISDDDAQAVLTEAWNVRQPLFRHCAALRPRPVRDTSQPVPARQAARRISLVEQGRPHPEGLRAGRSHRHRQILRHTDPARALRLFA